MQLLRRIRSERTGTAVTLAILLGLVCVPSLAGPPSHARGPKGPDGNGPGGGAGTSDPVTIGERPTIEHHLEQQDIDDGQVGLAELFEAGRILFAANFNSLDGQGRPGSTGAGAPRILGQPAFIRTSAPDASSCAGCHAQPSAGGAGDFVANVFVLAQTLDPVTESVSGDFSNERNTLGMMGAGAIEMLAREMTAELHAIRDATRQRAESTGMPATSPLVTKGVDFGNVTVLPDGRIDPSEIEGIDWDLVVKPFHQKGAVVSLREFTNNAMNHHHGMQSEERFGVGVDADLDGMIDELTEGDITAATVYQAALNTPGQVIPTHPARRRAVDRGIELFRQVDCTSCHIPSLTLDDPVFSEPNPYNPPGNLRPGDVDEPFRFDMRREGPKPRLQALPGGGAAVAAFTDLKRHDLTDADFDHFANEQIPQGKLNGFAPESDFTIPAPPRATSQFLTRKLWDVGNSSPYGHRGDLTMITDAIWVHGGEARASRDAFFALPQEDQDAVVEFLKSLQVLPDGSQRIAAEASVRR